VSLSILNNIAALYAQNNLNSTQSMLQTTLQQLSSGSRINSGADDPSGLAVANGMAANVAALTQSATNATSGIGLLQTADGALAQVTSLLDQATTLATETAGGTLTNAQLGSANQEYQNILTQIANIGAHTNFNSNQALTNSAVNIVVGDGTTTGTSTYTDIVGVLTKASVGTTGATPIAGVVSTAPIVAVPNTAGQYTLTAGASTDTLSGTISFNIGGGTQQNINVIAGSNLATVAGQISGALGGLSTSVSGNVINITGPTSGADAAADAVNFSGTSLSFAPAASNVAAGSDGTIVTPASPSLATLSLAGIPGNVTPSDTFQGTITLSQAGQTSKTVTIVPGSHLGPIASAGKVEYQIAQQLLGSGYTLTASNGNDADPVLHFSGADTSSPLTVTVGSFTDTYRGGVTFTAASPSNGSLGATQNTYTLGALASSADTFGSGAGNANTLDINGTNFSIAGMTATAAKLAINGNGIFQSAGISASVSSDGTTLTILGNSDGAALTVLGYNNGALALTDQPQYDVPAATALGAGTSTPNSMGSETTSQMTFGPGATIGDYITGGFTYQVGSGSAQTINLSGDTTLDNNATYGIVTQLNNSEAFQSAGLQASISSYGTPTLTITGPYGSTSSITLTAGTIADITQSNCTSNQVSTGSTGQREVDFIDMPEGDIDTFNADATLSIGGQVIDLSSGTVNLQDVANLINGDGGSGLAASEGYFADAEYGQLEIVGPTNQAPAIVTGGTFTDTEEDSTLSVDQQEPYVPTVPAESTLSINGSAAGDTIAGAISWMQNFENEGFMELAAGTTLTDSSTDPNSITYQLNHDSDFTSGGFTASLSGTNIVVSSNNGTLGEIYLSNSYCLVDMTKAASAVVNDVTTGGSETSGTYTLAALGSSSDTFGSGAGNANTLNIYGDNISIAKMTATEAMNAIKNNTTMQEYGISASVNGAGTQLTIIGDPWGDSLTVRGYNGGALDLTDQAPHLSTPTGTIAQIAAPTGSPAAGGTAVITMSSSTDTLSGPLKVVVNGHTASLTVAANTTGLELQNQINLDGSFQAANLTALYNSANATITITGPTGAGNTLDTTGTSLTDTTASGNLAGAGANFTTAGVSVLNASTAAAVLTTVTAAVADVAYQRGSLGADINELTSASNVASVESVNLASAQNAVTATDYGQAASNLSKYQILSQTGIAALAQANSVQQEVLKLLQ
jgi:flagellin